MPDIFKPVGPSSDDDKKPGLGPKLLWFVILAVAGVACVAGTAYLMRALLFIG
ncbi:hypothetical protein [Hyphococcus lacteus]|uniref:DUF2474 domain-containing protein n=1 Tax=Hyphococcus lacteus TaxID=3143536 RepID=A0ABV3Z2F8_9PROT